MRVMPMSLPVRLAAVAQIPGEWTARVARHVSGIAHEKAVVARVQRDDRELRGRVWSLALPSIGEQTSVAHPSGCGATGVSSNTSSFDVLCGQGIPSRQWKGPIRSRTPAMLRLGSSP